MLSASASPSNHRFPYAPPGRARRQAGSFAPGPSPALARRKTPHFRGPPPQKCSTVGTMERCVGRGLAFSFGAARAACRRVQLRCGSLRHQKPCVRQSQPHRFCCLRSSVSLRLGCTPAAIPPASASCRSAPLAEASGRRGGSRSGCWRRHCRFERGPNRQRLRRWGRVCAGPSAISVYPSNQPCHGPCRPGPRRPSAFPLFWRSLPAAGSLGSPVRCTVKARQGLTLPDRLRGHPPLPLVAPGPWWFRDSKPGFRF